jgi:coenzyme PQQ synthesis protein D (PqqD)
MSPYIIPSEVRSVSSTDGIAILDCRSGKFFSLNKVGSAVWTALTEGRAIDEIGRLMMSRYEVGVEPVEAELIDFLEKLESLGLVRRE